MGCSQKTPLVEREEGIMETAAYAFSSVSDAMSFQMGNLLAMPLFKVSVKSIAEPSYTGACYGQPLVPAPPMCALANTNNPTRLFRVTQRRLTSSFVAVPTGRSELGTVAPVSLRPAGIAADRRFPVKYPGFYLHCHVLVIHTAGDSLQKIPIRNQSPPRKPLQVFRDRSFPLLKFVDISIPFARFAVKDLEPAAFQVFKCDFGIKHVVPTTCQIVPQNFQRVGPASSFISPKPYRRQVQNSESTAIQLAEYVLKHVLSDMETAEIHSMHFSPVYFPKGGAQVEISIFRRGAGYAMAKLERVDINGIELAS
ncbi:hypothetical protein PG988_014559 [Apiospora saccharicola]